MITKAIVEDILSPYEVKIRVPLLDGASTSPLSTKDSNLNIATICSLPNCYINVQVGDVVFVGFEDNTYYKAVVLGHLSREAMSDTYADVTFGNMSILSSAILPKETSISEVTYNELSTLLGVRDNLQKQIDSLKDEISVLNEKIKGGSA